MIIKQEDVLLFLSNMEKNSITTLIEAEENEIKEFVEKRGLSFEDKRDFGFFKNVYAIADKANKNGAILPSEAIEVALESINGKPIDIDHDREYTVGFYLGARFEKGVIYSYGVIFKSNFQQEWGEIEKLFKDGKLATSFEIWCPKEKRTYNEDGTYSLNEITFAGGAVLFKTKPAFSEAVVLELAKEKSARKEELVLAKEEIIVPMKQQSQVNIENARKALFQIDSLWNAISGMECPVCKQPYYLSPTMINLEEDYMEARCGACGALVSIDLEPRTKVLEKDKKFKAIYIKEKTKKEEGTKMDFEKMYKEKEAELAKLQSELAVKASESETKVKQLSDEIAQLTAKLQEVESAKSEMKKMLDEASAFIKKIEDEEKSKEISKRKEILGEFAKDMKDEDLLDDAKFEIAKLKKENAELKAKQEKASEKQPLTAGVHGEFNTETMAAMRKRINELAFPGSEKNQ